jgi:probable F420-dependent oxidoreductase
METSVDLPLDSRLSVGFQLVLAPRGYEGGSEPGSIAELRKLVRLIDDIGFDSIWSGDHVAYAGPILDPLVQLAQVAALSDRLMVGTGVYLLPLRHPAPVAKQVGTLDTISGGRVIFGVGVGGEFPIEFQLCGVPVEERGARLSEGIRVLKALWSGQPVAFDGEFYGFPEVAIEPSPARAGGPPVWCGARADVALRRAGQLADGWISYVVTPERYRRSLETIAKAAHDAGRALDHFGTGHLLFMRLDKDRESALEFAANFLSARYAMDFRRAAERYCALGPAEDVAATIRAFHEAGMRHAVIHVLANEDDKYDHLEQFAAQVLPLLADLR